MTRDEYTTMKNERDVLKEEIIALTEIKGGSGDYRRRVEKLLTLTRVLDRAAAEYAEHKNDVTSDDGRYFDYCYQGDP